MAYAPIILFVYNRPWHTQQTIEALQKNELARQSDLIVYSDAAKNDEAKKSVEEVREIVRNITGFKQITVIERDRNWGLADSIIDGVTKVVKQYGKIIVLEDDIVTSPYFLKYMNDGLNYYQEQDKVMHISGWNYPIDTSELPETIFLRGTSCWGWATWNRAWQRFEKNPEKLSEIFTKSDRYKFDYDGSAGMWSQVTGNLSGKMNTWAIFWYATVFKSEGLCLHPSKSLVDNIGHDSSGVHCGIDDMYSTTICDEQVTGFSDEITESAMAMDRIRSFNFKHKKTFLVRVVNKLLKIIGFTK